MKEHPLIFQGWGIRAILACQKTMTRWIGNCYKDWKKGNLIWVRETWQDPSETKIKRYINYRATDDTTVKFHNWKPSIFMPRWASRLLLEMTADAREERLQEITEEDAEKEGVDPDKETGSYVDSFMFKWDCIKAKKPGCSWDDNPMVQVIEFRRVE